MAGTPSYRFNNLSMNVDGLVAYVDKSHIRVENAKERTGRLTPVASARLVQQAKFITIDCIEYLAVTSDIGVHLFDSTGSSLLSYFSVKDIHSMVKSNADPERSEYCCGIDGIQGTSMLVVGTSRGALATLHYDSRKKKLGLEQVTRLHRYPISSVVSSLSYIASADESGHVILWTATSLEEHCQFPSMGVPCCSVEIRADYVVAAFVSGVVRIYSIAQSRLVIEVDAHARALNSMSMHPFSNAFATCGEDGFVNVWQLPDKQNHDLQLLSSDQFENQLLVGVTFAKENACKLALTAYDSTVLMTRF